MIIEVNPSGPFETNAYVTACPETNIAAIIDPAPGSSQAIQDFIKRKNLHPKYLLLTHSHWDHIADVHRLKELYKIPVGIHPLDVPNLKEPGSDGLPCWMPIQGVDPDFLLQDGDVVSVGNRQFKIIHTPGHTPGGICFYCPAEAILFSGDTLFKGTIGNLSFPTACPHLMWPSLAKLSTLPPQTRVYPGHGPDTTIGAESWLANAEKIFGN